MKHLMLMAFIFSTGLGTSALAQSRPEGVKPVWVKPETLAPIKISTDFPFPPFRPISSEDTLFPGGGSGTETGTRTRSGNSIGSGGQSVICRNPDGTIERAEAFDLYEGRVLNGYQYNPPPRRSAQELALHYARSLDLVQSGTPGSPDGIESRLHYLFQNMIFLPKGVGLAEIHDSLSAIVPKDCDVVQTINFRIDRKIYADTDVWHSLPESSKAALYLHEAIYWQLRDEGRESDSRRTRRIVSFVMAGGKLEPRLHLPLTAMKRAQFCRSEKQTEDFDWDTKFFAFADTDGTLVLQFLKIGGYQTIERTIVSGTPQHRMGRYPINRDHKEVQRITGLIASKSGYLDGHVSLIWGRKMIALRGHLQQGVTVNERISCMNWDI
jgi:hypothetical protein